MKWRFNRLKEKEICPYCGDKCIAFHKIVQAGNIWRSPKCPNCGAKIRLEKKLVIIKRIIDTLIIAFVVLTLNTDAYLIRFWSITPLLMVSLLEIIIALLSDLDYEEFWNYPKPKDCEH